MWISPFATTLRRACVRGWEPPGALWHPIRSGSGPGRTLTCSAVPPGPDGSDDRSDVTSLVSEEFQAAPHCAANIIPGVRDCGALFLLFGSVHRLVLVAVPSFSFLFLRLDLQHAAAVPMQPHVDVLSLDYSVP